VTRPCGLPDISTPDGKIELACKLIDELLPAPERGLPVHGKAPWDDPFRGPGDADASTLKRLQGDTPVL